jgi:hypothetical protein
VDGQAVPFSSVPVIHLGGDPIDVTVHFNIAQPPGGGDAAARFALIRNGSTTHAFDQNQRYVQLQATVFSTAWPDVTYFITPPVDGFEAPPGNYLLTVVDKDQHPSEGLWVRVTE